MPRRRPERPDIAGAQATLHEGADRARVARRSRNGWPSAGSSRTASKLYSLSDCRRNGEVLARADGPDSRVCAFRRRPQDRTAGSVRPPDRPTTLREPIPQTLSWGKSSPPRGTHGGPYEVVDFEVPELETLGNRFAPRSTHHDDAQNTLGAVNGPFCTIGNGERRLHAKALEGAPPSLHSERFRK